MKISVKVVTRSKSESIERLSDGTYLVRVSLPPSDGKANLGVVNLLARHFNVPKSSVRILVGHKSNKKIIYINDGS